MRIAVHDYAGHPFQFDLSRELARRGHEVLHVYFAGDKGPKGRTERGPDDPAGFRIAPVEIGRDYAKGDFVSRLRNDREYGRRAAAVLSAFAPDVVISGNTPLDAQGPLIAATHRAGGAFVFWMQDFYSRAIAGILSRKWLGLGAQVAAHYARVERSQLRRSDGVVLISPDFRGPAEAWGVAPDRIEVIPNWGAIESLPVRPKDTAWARDAGLADRFVFLYSGTLGLKHDPDLLVSLADSFAGDPEVLVVTAATGLGRDRLAAELERRPRPNLRLAPLQPLELLPEVLGAADVVVALLEADAGEFSMPSKILSYYCAGRAILLSAPLANMAARTTSDIGAGRVTAPGDAAAFVAAAQQLRTDAGARAKAGEAGRAYAEAHFRIGAVADRFEAVFLRAGRRRVGTAQVESSRAVG